MRQDLWNRNLPLRRAFAASLGLHALFALFLPVFDRSPKAGVQPIERVSFVRITNIHLALSRHAQPLPPARPPAMPSHPATTPPRLRANPIARAVSKKSVVPIAYGAPAKEFPAATAAQPSAAPSSTASEQPRPQETGAVNVPRSDLSPNSMGGRDVGGVMPFGAALPEPVLDPKVRAELGRRFGNVHVKLVVTVGDDGRTKSVEFHPPLDARIQAEISALLAAANWDAAVCGGGIPCAGRTTITP